MESGGEWRSYRCPVCSHTDGVSLAGTAAVLIRCSHCETPLRVETRGASSVAVTVAPPTRRRDAVREHA